MDRGKKERKNSTTESPLCKACHPTKLPAVLRDSAGRRGRKNTNNEEGRESEHNGLSIFFRYALPEISSISPV